jgi:phosphatidylserine/phosphatidylglycerophosphate/cardiolipin synthase-like enzyme
MKFEEWEVILRKTAQDAKLSRGERSVLQEKIKEAALDAGARALLRSRAFEIARELARDGPPGGALDWLEEVVKLLLPPTGDGGEVFAEVQFSPGDQCARRITGLLEGCRRSADLCVFTITDDRITASVLRCHQRGVKVRVVTDNEKAFDEGSDVRRMAHEGIAVRVDDSPFHMHHKFALFDGGTVLTGSYNWTVGAARNNQENLVVANDRRLVNAFTGEFERLWKQFEAQQL